MKAVGLVDIDGNIMPFNSSRPQPEDSYLREVKGFGDCIILEGRIHDLVRIFGDNLWLHTSWAPHETRGVFVQDFGRELEHLSADRSGPWSKVDAVEDALPGWAADGVTHIVWMDDAGHDENDLEQTWEDIIRPQAEALGLKLLMVVPHKHVGLTRSDIRSIEEFLRS